VTAVTIVSPHTALLITAIVVGLIALAVWIKVRYF